jgi:hypothetical protein
MIKAAFVSAHADWPWKRQLPQGVTCQDGVEFFVPVSQADVVFFYDALPEKTITLSGKQVTVFVASEPQNVKRYNTKFLSQFDFVITSDRETPHPNRIFSHSGLPWHVGSMAAGGRLLEKPMVYEDLEKHEPVKTKLVSVVSSDKAFTVEHRARLAFVARLKEALGDQVDVFGRGIVDFADKRDVLDAYRYHIAIENCSIPDFFTEKLADPYLTLTFPIYHGCPNVTDYFPDSSLRQIDIYKPDEAIAIIKDIIGSDLAEKNRADLLEARRRIMHEHNLFGLLAQVARDLVAEGSRAAKDRSNVLCAESRFLPLLERSRGDLLGLIKRYPKLHQFIKRVKKIDAIPGSLVRRAN